MQLRPTPPQPPLTHYKPRQLFLNTTAKTTFKPPQQPPHFLTTASFYSLISPQSAVNHPQFTVTNEPCQNDKNTNFFQFLKLMQSFVPGGGWWNLSGCSEDDTGDESSPLSVTVIHALRRIWRFVGHDQWVVFAAFASLTVAAISEISMPSLLAACIFSAQTGESVAFYRNSRLLIILCLISGICSGVRGYCFGLANMILVKRLRDAVYSLVLFQELSFFDTESVGSLTSRLGSDCQRLSRLIGNDLHVILRNILQGGGALFNLFILSQPLALSAFAICLILSSIFLIYGPYQKEAAVKIQELEARANEIAHGAYSSFRTIRAYGTEKEEFRRYKHCLNKITFCNIRESVAYGLWSLSFSTLYRSTQIVAVLYGGKFVASGELSSEQLIKYILYCEWLIYATWRVVDHSTSMVQSVGASEKLFQLLDLQPISQLSSKGVVLPQLHGDVEFVNVSFHYPTREQAVVFEHVNLCMRANEVIAIASSCSL